MGWKEYFKRMTIKSKMHLYIGFSVAVIMVVSFSYFIYSLRTNTRNDAVKITEELIKGYSNQILNVTNKAFGFAESLGSTTNYMFDGHTVNKDSILKRALMNSAKLNTNFKCIWVSLEHSAITPGYNKPSGRRTFLTIPSSNIPISVVDKDMDGYDQNGLYYLVKDKQKTGIKEPYMYNYYNNSDQMYITTITYPVVYNGKGVGVSGVDISMDDFQKIVDKINIYPGTKAFLVSSGGMIAAHSDKNLIGKTYDKMVSDQTGIFDLNKTITNDELVNDYVKINGIEYYTVVIPFEMDELGTHWELGVMVPTSEMFAASRSKVLIAILVCLLGLIITTLIINLLAKRITNPLNDVTQSIKKLSQGEINETEKLSIATGDELEEIAGSVNVLIDGLNQTARFAQKIGEGNLNENHHLLGENDLLGKSLEDMRKSLIVASEKEAERKKDEEKSTWSNQGFAKFADLLRQNNSNINELSFSIVSNLVKYLEINQGGIFILDENSDEPKLQMTACFAYNRRKLAEKTFEPGEGLVGRCFTEAETIYLLDIPNDYISITSGLGDTNPSCLLLVPLKVNNEVNGVIELASLTPIDDYKVKFVEKVAESIAATLSSVKINIHTAELLSQTRQQAEEMAAQEEEMRQNLEELQSTQEEMARVQEEQKTIQEELFKEKSMFANFLEAVPEAIYFKDLQSRLIKFSKSLGKIHGKSADEIVGKSDFDLFGYGEHSQKAFNDEQEIIRTGQPIFNMVEREDHADGRVTWVTTNKMPLRDLNGNIIGTFGISKDFSEIMELQNDLSVEKALFSNFLDSSQDIIYFKDLEGRFIKVNKTKYESHGFVSESEIIGKTDKDILGDDYSESAAKEELEIAKTKTPILNRAEQKPDKNGKIRWFSVSKLPLIDHTGNVIGIWGITRDITEIKLLEEQLSSQNSVGDKVDLN